MSEVNLNLGQLREVISRTVTKIVNEGYYYNDDESDARVDFEDSGFEYELNNRYPEVNFDYEVEKDGTVKVTDIESGNYYISHAEAEYVNEPLGHPDPKNTSNEAEGNVTRYEFTNCLREIMEKIDSNKPDGNDK